MATTFQLPEAIEQHLRAEFADLDQAAKEAALVELYRQGKIGQYELAQAPGLSRYETDGVLKRHRVYCDLTLEDVPRDAETSRLGPIAMIAVSDASPVEYLVLVDEYEQDSVTRVTARTFAPKARDPGRSAIRDLASDRLGAWFV